MSELKKLVGSGRGATSITVPSSVSLGEGVDRILAFMPGGELVDLRLVNLGVDLHAGDIGQAEDLLPLANRRPFLDLGLVAAEGPVGIVGINDQAVGRRP